MSIVRPLFIEQMERRVMLSGTLEPTSWIGNSYAGNTTSNYVQMDAKDLTVRPSDGRVIAVTWWDEGTREGGVYNGSTGQPVANLSDMHGKGALAAVATEGFIYVGWQSSNGANIRRYSQTNFAPSASSAWSNQSSILVSSTGLLTGLALSGSTIYASNIKTDTVYAYSTTDRSLITSWTVPNPQKMAVAGGALWVIQKSNDAYAATGGKVVKYGLDGSTTGVEITDLVDPTAINVAPNGQLMIADSGAARNHIRYYNVASTPALASTFGRSINSDVPGQVAPDKFDYITGIDTDTAGNLYVSFNGGGVTHDVWTDGMGLTLRKFDPSGNLLWQKIGHQFVDSADAAPTDENDVYTLHEHYRMNYDNPAGQEATWVGSTLNRDLYPQDPRLFKGHSYVVAVQEIQGTRVMFTTDMYGDYFTSYRFEGDTAVPFVMLHKKNETSFPVNKPTTTNSWLWNDLDGQGDFDASEYDTAGGFHWGLTEGWFVDSKGDLWQTRRSSNGVARYRFQGLNDQGVPIYDFANTTVTFLASHLGTDPFTQLRRAEYDADNDRMFLTGFTSTYNGTDVKSAGRVTRRYDNWSTTPTFVSQMVLPTGGAILNVQPEGAASVAVEGRYVFTVTADAKKVTVFDSNNGSQVAQFGPDTTVGSHSGIVDVIQGLRVHQRSNGQFVIFVEEDARAKVMMYSWTPDVPNSGVVAVNDTATTQLDTPVTINVLANDTDADNDPLAINQVAPAGHGSVAIVNGQVVYTPDAGFTGTDSFSYTATDRKGTFSEATVTLTVSSASQAIQATHDATVRGGAYASVNEGSNTVLALKNDSSADFDRMVFLKFDTTAFSSISNAKFVFTPVSGGTNVANMTVRIRLLADGDDGWNESTITWNNMPTGSGSAVTFSGSSLVYNQQRELDVTTLVQQAMNANGIVSLHLDVTSSPHSQGSFNIASSEHSNPDYRPVLVINTGNAAPIAADDAAVTPQGDAVAIPVLANDSDPDGDPLSITAVTQGANGSVVVSGSQVIYTPAPAFHGTDSFTYTASDNGGGSDTASVNVTVSQSAVTNLSSVNDATVRGGSFASSNYGSDAALYVKDDPSSDYDRQSYLQFDLSGISNITNARLVLTPTSLGSDIANMTLGVRMIDDVGDSWNESTLNWNNRPGAAGDTVSFLGSTLAVGQAIELDVTALLQQSLHLNSLASFQIAATSAAGTNRVASFASDEHATIGYRPMLILTTA